MHGAPMREVYSAVMLAPCWRCTSIFIRSSFETMWGIELEVAFCALMREVYSVVKLLPVPEMLWPVPGVKHIHKEQMRSESIIGMQCTPSLTHTFMYSNLEIKDLPWLFAWTVSVLGNIEPL